MGEIIVKPIHNIHKQYRQVNLVNSYISTKPAYPVSNIVSYYQMEDSVNDSVGIYNGTSTAITYDVGLVGKTAIFNGTTSKISDIYQLSYGSFSLVALIKTNSAAEKMIFSFRYALSGNPIVIMAISGGKLYTRLRSSANTGITTLTSTRSVNNNAYRVVCLTFDVATGLQSNYIDGTFENSVVYSGGTFGTMTPNLSFIGVGEQSGSYGFWSGNIDEAIVFNAALTSTEVAGVTTKLLSGQHLI